MPLGFLKGPLIPGCTGMLHEGREMRCHKTIGKSPSTVKRLPGYSGLKDLPSPAGDDPLKIRTIPRSHGEPLLDVFAELLSARYMMIRVKIMSGKGATWNTWAGTEGHHP